VIPWQRKERLDGQLNDLPLECGGDLAWPYDFLRLSIPIPALFPSVHLGTVLLLGKRFVLPDTRFNFATRGATTTPTPTERQRQRPLSPSPTEPYANAPQETATES